MPGFPSGATLVGSGSPELNREALETLNQTRQQAERPRDAGGGVGAGPLTTAELGAALTQIGLDSPYNRAPLFYPASGTSLWISRLNPNQSGGGTDDALTQTLWTEVTQHQDGPHGPGAALQLLYAVDTVRQNPGTGNAIYGMVAIGAGQGEGIRPTGIRGTVYWNPDLAGHSGPNGIQQLALDAAECLIAVTYRPPRDIRDNLTPPPVLPWLPTGLRVESLSQGIVTSCPGPRRTYRRPVLCEYEISLTRLPVYTQAIVTSGGGGGD